MLRKIVITLIGMIIGLLGVGVVFSLFSLAIYMGNTYPELRIYIGTVMCLIFLIPLTIGLIAKSYELGKDFLQIK
jgi:hypothetical protein